ncbi:hypothetical protein E4U42_008032 [Claviceps africana]|uniref:FAD-binding FR-type domain-containing protein n=1 Tax=Claviceps africana TaxID=83212 RepID=A0A8K0JAC6_9HYPO|nr:hypothetical protein E4U42_008032 [Claviceps africana]
MGWPYGFPALTEEDKQLRRQALDLYASIAHYSALAPALAFLLYRLSRHVIRWAARASASASTSGEQGRYVPVPGSPMAKAQHQRGVAGKLTAQWRKIAWQLGDDVYLAGSHWGQWDEWLLGALWTAWLLVLSVRGTGNDYFHLTKRLGAVAVSQLPIQYLLALKSLNPFAWAFESSHEHINRYHRVLGRIIYGLVLLHLILYNAYFLYAGIWLQRILDSVVFCGMVASLGLHGIMATAIRVARQLSYRLFFIMHVAVAVLMPVLLFFHASSARLYIVEAVVVFVVDLAVRRITTIHAPSTLETVPGTTLVKVTSSIPAHRVASFRATPGSHIYLSIPPSSRTATIPSSKSSVVDLLFNPFTVAAVDEQRGTIDLVARVRRGPMTKILSDFSSASASAAATSAHLTEARKTILGILGPYGTMTAQFNHLLQWGPNRVLLVSGGVGATFTLPIYHALQSELPSAKLQLIWAVRTASDATWAVRQPPTGNGIVDDPNIHIFLTGDIVASDGRRTASGDDIELSQFPRMNGRSTSNHDRNRKRPDIQKIVDDTFRHSLGESVAVLVCGPADMTREVRHRVGAWARKGRRLWWHNETFGW